MFFFEKKNQKTFSPWRMRPKATHANWQKFFASFFQKRSLSFYSLSSIITPLTAGTSTARKNRSANAPYSARRHTSRDTP